MRIQLTNEPIAHQDMVENCRSKSAGAVVLFLGTVREITGNEQTLFLEYEAFAPLAEKALAEIAEQAKSKWAIEKLEIIHRLGILEPGKLALRFVSVALIGPMHLQRVSKL